MKKMWINPELKNLGIENTRTDICEECGCPISDSDVMLLIEDDSVCYARKGGHHGGGHKPACSGGKPHHSGCGHK